MKWSRPGSPLRWPETGFIQHRWQGYDEGLLLYVLGLGSLTHPLPPESYRAYVQRSRAELMIAKGMYVQARSGWFSDRSACYLAAGRPVITQETGFTKIYGQQGGLFGFRKLPEIAEAVREINGNYRRHSRAAREIAREFFEAEKVLASLLDRAGL